MSVNGKQRRETRIYYGLWKNGELIRRIGKDREQGIRDEKLARKSGWEGGVVGGLDAG
jgi:hypothetical protein